MLGSQRVGTLKPFSDQMEENAFFPTRKVVISVNFSIVSYKPKCASHFGRETGNENKQFK